MADKGKKRQSAKKKRKLDEISTCDGTDHDNREDEELFDDAQKQLEAEMMAAGLAGQLPMSFGAAPASQTSKKRKRQVVNTTPLQPVVKPSVPQIMEKVHVKYDSDGEVAAREVERVTAPVESTSADERQAPDEQATVTDECAAIDASTTSSSAEPENAIVPVGADSECKKVEQPVPDATDPVYKFWKQRYNLFYKYDEGILMDHEGWFSVTPQAIAEHIAARCTCDVIVDPFAGCGGNVIQLARTCKHVIAIDIDPEKIRMARHNAKIYGVADKIEWIVGNSLEILPTIRADAVFLSPPWGGMNYNRTCFQLDDMVLDGNATGTTLFQLARQVTRNIAYYLPKTTPEGALEALGDEDEHVECEFIHLNRQLKVVTAYYGDLAVKPVAPSTAAVAAAAADDGAVQEAESSQSQKDRPRASSAETEQN
ncbi:TPA: hypothetical protein N0F65_008334 [Lagenidium giganteum]|uniref:Trimethylguanosine synthase n=1 Tax=Lagenidium giganteum TaxID=4803 RepID=A0AAV2YQ01_9STRA|nr:TPA: hypothetical protein N0F65_008334 [Lagenidium giganteum]